MSEGHPNARDYPIQVLWDEALIARARVNSVLASEALLLQLAVGALFSKESSAVFQRQLKRLI